LPALEDEARKGPGSCSVTRKRPGREGVVYWGVKKYWGWKPLKKTRGITKA